MKRNQFSRCRPKQTTVQRWPQALRETSSVKPTVLHTRSALQIRAGQRSITANFQSLTADIYHVMIIVTGSFSKWSFSWLILFLFPRNLLNDLELVCLEVKHLQNTNDKSVYFISSFFICCFVIILCINSLHLFILFRCV